MYGSMLAHVFPVGGRDAAVRLFPTFPNTLREHIVDMEVEFLLLHCLTVDYLSLVLSVSFRLFFTQGIALYTKGVHVLKLIVFRALSLCAVLLFP